MFPITVIIIIIIIIIIHWFIFAVMVTISTSTISNLKQCIPVMSPQSDYSSFIVELLLIFLVQYTWVYTVTHYLIWACYIITAYGSHATALAVTSNE